MMTLYRYNVNFDPVNYDVVHCIVGD